MLARTSLSAALVLAAVCCGGAACQPVPQPKGLLDRELTPPNISSHQLRVMVNEYVVYSAHRLELCADTILADNPDTAVRKNVLLWKINGIAASFQAGSRRDSLGAYLDLWVLNRQMMHLFESPQGTELLGHWQSAATAECYALDERLRHISRTLSSDLRMGEDFVEKFATDYPLRGLYFDREPIASRYIEEVQTPSQDLLEVAANLDSNLGDLRKLTILYAEHLPKQARWEAELFMIEATQLATVQRPLLDLSLTADALSRIADTTQSLPQMVEQERRALSTLVTEEREQTLHAVDAMRSATMSQVGDERSIVLAKVGHERELLLASFHAERVAMTDELKAEVASVIKSADTMTQQRAAELIQQAPEVIDHLFWRVWQIILSLAVVIASVAAWLLRRDTQPRAAAQLPVVPAETEKTGMALLYVGQHERAA